MGKDIVVNSKNMRAEVDLMKNATYIVKDGILHEIPKPEEGYGTQIINWQGGKPCHGKLEHVMKF